MQPVATIGVYGFTAEMFLDQLRMADVGRLLDVRQRRGVRGSDYAWANSARLQAALADADIDYRHHKELAPTTELRQLQYARTSGAGSASGREPSLHASTANATSPRSLTTRTLIPCVAELPAANRQRR